MLFDALNDFDLAAAFECCRIDYTASSTPYDATGFFRGWEMQTGVVAYNTNAPSVKQFWAAALQIYKDDSNYCSRSESSAPCGLVGDAGGKRPDAARRCDLTGG